MFYVCFTKFKNNQILINKISYRFLLTTKLYTEGKILIEALELLCVIRVLGIIIIHQGIDKVESKSEIIQKRIMAH
jgi:hypothetical protein